MKKNESTVSDVNKLFVTALGGKLFRNNSGVLKNQDGVPIRFGLGNTSAKINKLLKSSDQIGLMPTLITPDMVGKTVGVFMAIEDKHSTWTEKTDEHTVAQRNFIELVKRLGGIACFATSTRDIVAAIEDWKTR